MSAADLPLLNASAPDVNYLRTAADIVAAVNAALTSNDSAAMLQLATEPDVDNNLACPLN